MQDKAVIGDLNRTNRRFWDSLDRTTLYTSGIGGLGLLIIFNALFNLPEDLSVLLFFALMAAVAELGSVALYVSSRQSRVSVSSMIAIAGILVLGPSAGALIHMMSGLMSMLTTSLVGQAPKEGQASRLRRALFNAGMLVTAAFISGHIFVWTGGTPGHISTWGNIFPIFATASADTLINLLILIQVISLQTGRPPLQILKQDFEWAIPIAIVGGVIGGGALGLAYEMFGITGLLVFFLPVLATSYSFRLYVKNTKGYVNRLEQLNQDLEKANNELEMANVELLEALGAVIDAYDVYTRGHSKQVAVYAGDLAQKLNLPESEQARIVRAALVHDIGKVGITDTIISKDGPLSKEEYNMVKRHPMIGAEIIGQMTGLKDLVPLVRHHHERWDGGGYPHGLKADQIPIGARVLALADTLDVICSDRPYRDKRSLREMKEEIARCSGTQFDPQVVAAFFELAEEKGSDYFKNTAAALDQAMLVKGITGANQSVRHFLKKSMMD